jgi:hypothetical protein
MLREKIKEYIEVSGAVDNMSKVVDAANGYMLSQLQGSPEEIDDIKRLNEKYMKILQGRMDEFRDKFVDLYIEFYTEEDVDALLAYHKSPVAQKVRAVGDKLLARAIEISSDFNKELLKQLSGATLNREVN